MRWVVQYNLGKEYADNIEEACKSLGHECVHIKVKPFSKELPDFPRDEPTLFYGATRWVNMIWESGLWAPGVYFNPDATAYRWLAEYGEAALNYGAAETTLSALSMEPCDPDRLFFIRPARDLKEFNGCVWDFKKIQRWREGLRTDLETEKLATIPIIAGEAWHLTHEWRLFMVDGRISSGSHYRGEKGLDINPNLPREVQEFAVEQASIYSPCPVFVMDICECGGELYVLEIGCVHSAGFYASNVRDVIRDVSER